MTIGYAIKSLERKGWKAVSSSKYAFHKEGLNEEISFLPNGEDRPDQSVVCLRVRALHDQDEFQSDYIAGAYCDTIPQALRMAHDEQ